MPTFVNIVATTAATTIAPVGTSAPFGITLTNMGGNAANSVIRVSNVSTDIATNGCALTLNQSTILSPYQCGGDVGNIWVYANTTGQTVCVSY
jgi:hypothetical protein